MKKMCVGQSDTHINICAAENGISSTKFLPMFCAHFTFWERYGLFTTPPLFQIVWCTVFFSLCRATSLRVQLRIFTSCKQIIAE